MRNPTFILISLFLFIGTIAHGQNISGLVSRVADTTHFEFKGRKDWPYESPVKQGNKVSIILPALDQASIDQLEHWACPFIKSVEVNQNAPDGRHELIITLNSQEVESFDYLTDDPSHLIIDFYQKADATKSTENIADYIDDSGDKRSGKSASKKKKLKNKVAKLPEKVDVDNQTQGEYKKIDRKPAGGELLSIGTNLPQATAEEGVNIDLERGVFDGSDKNFDRFRIKNYQISESAIIGSRNNIYVEFPVLEQRLNRFDELMKLPPIYEIKPQDTSENKEARFLLTLFNRGRWGSFFESLKYFNGKYPHSVYDETIKNISAEAYIKMFDKDKNKKDMETAQSIYSYLIETYPQSPLTERNHLLLAYSHLRQGNGAEALRYIQKTMTNLPKSQERDRLELATAEAYQLLKKPEDAMRTLNELPAKADDKTYAVESVFRRGDVLMSEKKFDTAVKAYDEANKQYPEFTKLYANAAYNKAEALFWMGRHKESLEQYIDFLKFFPTHAHGGYALTRIGELLEVMGAPQQQIIGAFTEGYFRFPNSPGSEVARIRMLSQGLKGMPDREKKRALAEIDEIAKKSTLPRIEEFSTLLKAEGFVKRGENPHSLDLLLSYYQQHPTTADFNLFRARILRNVSDILKEQISANKYIDALNTYGKYSTNWLKNSNRLDTTYFQGKAYEQADVKKEAEVIYQKVLVELKKIAGTQAEKEKKVLENLPTVSQVNLRLAAIALSDRRYRDSYNFLREVTQPMTESEEFEKIQLQSEVAEQMGDHKSAINSFMQILSGFPERQDLKTLARIRLLKIMTQQGRLDDAEKYLKQLEEQKAKGQIISEEEWAQILELRGDLQFRQGQKLAAVETYAQLLESFENRLPLSSIRYKAGKILFDEGDLNGAGKMWNGFDSKMGDFYKKMANEKLNQAAWQDTYKKYINRIPAAENLR